MIALLIFNQRFANFHNFYINLLYFDQNWSDVRSQPHSFKYLVSKVTLSDKEIEKNVETEEVICQQHFYTVHKRKTSSFSDIVNVHVVSSNSLDILLLIRYFSISNRLYQNLKVDTIYVYIKYPIFWLFLQHASNNMRWLQLNQIDEGP